MDTQRFEYLERRIEDSRKWADDIAEINYAALQGRQDSDWQMLWDEQARLWNLVITATVFGALAIVLTWGFFLFALLGH